MDNAHTLTHITLVYFQQHVSCKIFVM